ncbi:MAG: hypothetical protein KA314_28590 [Chloroflexi bacterium]|nr:hypothetical protein [Chloroflexota bacterium]MBP8059815.1 hypothetical protein [Chloroflexota bacterium]
MRNSCENVGRFGKSPGGRFKKSSYKFSSLLVRPQAHEELLRKCRAIWQIARWTIYQIVLQIFIPLGAAAGP